MKGKGYTLWFTGLSAAGKTTLSDLVGELLRLRGVPVESLDGDIVRTNLCQDLGFSKKDRDTNIHRIAFVSSLLSRNGVAVLVSAISPYRKARRAAREMIEEFIEVFVHCPVEKCIERDVKGLYKKALKGEIEQFTGVSDPYEEPEHPEIQVETHRQSIEDCVRSILGKLEERGLVSRAATADAGKVFSASEEEALMKRIRALG